MYCLKNGCLKAAEAIYANNLKKYRKTAQWLPETTIKKLYKKIKCCFLPPAYPAF
jgi:hypothetical protein